MSVNPEQFYKPERKEEKPRLKLNLNLGVEDKKWNTVLQSPDLKKIGINTPELDRMAANSANSFHSYTHNLPPPYSSHHEEPAVQGPNLGDSDDLGESSFISALQKIQQQNGFQSETFTIPATVAGPAAYTDYAKPQMPECSQSWNTSQSFQAPVSNYSYAPNPQQFMTTQPSTYVPDSLPPYPLDNKLDIPDPNQIDKLNLTTAQKLSIYSQIPIHEVTDPELQERLKCERKKMRNRIAASKCRKRKLEKEAELEDKVKHLKKKNGDLSSQLLGLKEEVKELKVKIMHHVNAGCKIKQYTGVHHHHVNVTRDSDMPIVSEPTLNSMVTQGNLQLGHLTGTTPVTVSLPNMHLNV